jgi:uncharacterized protein involved in type VI secretion and phage assembly
MYGKYRGIVIDNIDRESIGRVQVSVPAVLGEQLSWALPCSPFAGPDVGLCLIPPVGANVWVEFEGGDTGHPIWSGCFWGRGEYPAEAQVQPPEKVQVLKGYGFKLVANSVGPTGLTIEVSPPMLGRRLSIVLDNQGIQINNQDEMKMTLANDKIELDAQHQSRLSMTPSEITIATPATSIEMTQSKLDLTNGGASVKMSPATVNVNNGALEVI